MDKQDFIDYQGKGIYYQMSGPEKAQKGLLFIHGSEASSSTYKIINLLKKDFLCLGFDFLGAQEGRSGMEFKDTIRNRILQAKFMFDYLKKMGVKNISVIGTSLGAHVATRLVEHSSFDSLILRAPAAFSSSLEDVEIKELVKEKSWDWENSDIFETLKNFSGNYLLVESEKDDVISKEMIQKFLNSPQKAKTKKHVVMKDALHYLGPFPEQIKVFSELIREFINEV